MHWKNSQYRFIPAACVLLLALLVLVLHHADPGYAQSAADKSGVINLQGVDIDAAGFTAAEMLINTNFTLNRPYYVDPTADPFTNRDGITNNNICERPDDSVAGYKDEISNSELTACWVTWDNTYMYFAVQGQAKGENNNLMAVIDSNVDVGVRQFDLLSHFGAWKRNIYFDEGIIPNVYLGFWCANGTANYNATDPGGNTHLNYGDGYGASWTRATASANQAALGDYYSWYNGTAQVDPTKRLWCFRVHWRIITNAAASPNNLKVRFSFASTGPWDGSRMYDYMPETQYAIRTTGDTIQNNYFEVQPFDASGQVRLGISPRDSADIKFFPGSRWDLPNFPDGKLPIEVYADSDRPAKVFTPNGDGRNDRLRFSFLIKFRKLNRCSMYVFDLKGRKVRTVFSDEEFEISAGTEGRLYNGPASDPRSFADSRLEWDGLDDNGRPLPIGIYVIQIYGKDADIDILGKKAVSLVR